MPIFEIISECVALGEFDDRVNLWIPSDSSIFEQLGRLVLEIVGRTEST